MKEIQLTQDKVALVDDYWYDYLMQWSWYCRHDAKSKTFYAARGSHQKTIFMHRVIMTTPDTLEVNHIDFDGLNNQAYNLENVTHAQNTQHRQMSRGNTSGYVGVTKCRNSWHAALMANGVLIYLGSHKTKEDAAKSYDDAAIKYFGERAFVNFKKGTNNE
jgi:hypothetical protein